MNMMTLSDEALERLADVVELQPTKNAELQDRWEMDSGSEVHGYLEGELSDYYFRDDDSLIRATAEAADLVDVEPGIVTEDDEGPSRIRVDTLQSQIVDVLSGPDGETKSVVSVLHALRETFDVDPDPDEIRSRLNSLKRKGVVEVVYRTVPTYRLAVDRDDLEISVND